MKTRQTSLIIDFYKIYTLLRSNIRHISPHIHFNNATRYPSPRPRYPSPWPWYPGLYKICIRFTPYSVVTFVISHLILILTTHPGTSHPGPGTQVPLTQAMVPRYPSPRSRYPSPRPWYPSTPYPGPGTPTQAQVPRYGPQCLK